MPAGHLYLYAKWMQRPCGITTLDTNTTSGIPCTINLSASTTNGRIVVATNSVPGTAVSLNIGNLKYNESIKLSCNNTH